jgi:hypothetical protein
MNFLTIKNHKLADWILSPITLWAIILFGHYGLFFGHHFIVWQDPEVVFSYGIKDEHFSGWRPDIGSGITHFFGDPGLFHTWSLFRLWGILFQDPIWANSSFILILLWVACVVLYFFLRKTVPGLNRVTTIGLSSLIVFGSLRYDYFFQRHWILLTISSALVSLILYDFFKSPSPKHFYLYTLTLFSSLFLGSSRILATLLIFTVAFFFLHTYYYGFHKNLSDFWVRSKRFFLLNFVAGICILFLGAWVFYSIFHEILLTTYVRDPNNIIEYFFKPDISPLSIIQRVQSFLLSGIFSPSSGIMGITHVVPRSGVYNISPIFPLVFIILIFQRSRDFWEFCAKFTVAGFIFIRELLDLVPGVRWLLPNSLNTFGNIEMSPAIQVFEIVLLGIFIQRIQESNLLRKPLEILIVRRLAIALSLLYGFLILLASGSKFTPKSLTFIFQEIFQWISNQVAIGEEKKEFISAVISGNIQLLHETMGLSYIFFYGLTFFLVLNFSNKSIPEWFSWKKSTYFSILLLFANIFLSWAVYPLSDKPFIWQRQNLPNGSPPFNIRKYDRIAKVNAAERCESAKNFIDCVKFKILEGEFGPKRFVGGYRLNPGLDFSGTKSFSQKEVASLITKFLEIDGLNIKGSLRYLQQFPPFSLFKIYDFSGVKYFVSPYRLPTSDKIKLVHSSFQFYLYQNMNAWPYYYLADQIETITEMEQLYDAKKGVAYLWADHKKNVISGHENKSDNQVELEYFSFGEMKFRSLSINEEFLVVMDSWHPYWRAQVDGREVEVIKANGVFKGIPIPEGDHNIRLFFDNKPYRYGIWVSVLSWILFISSWVRLYRKLPVQSNK